MPVEWALGCFVRFREIDRGTPVTAMVKVSGRRPSQVAGLGTGRRTETFTISAAPGPLTTFSKLGLKIGFAAFHAIDRERYVLVHDLPFPIDLPEAIGDANRKLERLSLRIRSVVALQA